MGAGRSAYREFGDLLRLLSARSLSQCSSRFQRASRYGLCESARAAPSARLRNRLGGKRLSGGERRREVFERESLTYRRGCPAPAMPRFYCASALTSFLFTPASLKLVLL